MENELNKLIEKAPILKLEEGDVVILKADCKLNLKQYDLLKMKFENILKHSYGKKTSYIILDRGLDIQILRRYLHQQPFLLKLDVGEPIEGIEKVMRKEENKKGKGEKLCL